jgi:hypothetical protein
VRRTLVISVTAVALIAGGADAASTTGVRGVFYRGPVAPVCQVGTPCDAPVPGLTIVFTREGHAVSTRTGDGGHFSVALRPGLYTARLVPTTTVGTGLSPRTVRVPVGGWARVRMLLDTGIRCDRAFGQYATTPTPVSAACFCSSAR